MWKRYLWRWLLRALPACLFIGALAGEGVAQDVPRQDPARPINILPFSIPASATKSTAKIPTPTLSVERDSRGQPVLRITNVWKRLTQPSIQIALVTDPQASLNGLEPLSLDGSAAIELWTSQVNRLHQPTFPGSVTTVGSTEAFLVYNDGQRRLIVRGRDNAIRKPSVHGFDDGDGSRLVFYLLDNWTDERRGVFQMALSDLDMVPKFAQEGRIRVWLLDQEKVVWTETAAWPGKESAKPRESIGAMQSASETPKLEPMPLPTKTESTLSLAEPPTTPKPERSTAPAKLDPGASAPSLTAPQAQPSATPSTLAPPAIVNTTRTAGSNAPAPPNTPGSVKVPENRPVAPSATWTPVVPPPIRPAPSLPATTVEPSQSRPITEMAVEELASYIEQHWGVQMSSDVRRAWSSGMTYYFKTSNNPEPVRRAVFMSLLITCFKAQPSGDLRDAIAVLYRKLKKMSI